MNRFFASDSKFMLTLSKFFDIVLLSMIFLVCCIPVITIGPALTALYYTTRKVIIKREGYLFKEYFHSFRINFLSAFFAWIILFLVYVVMFVNIMYVITSLHGGLEIALLAFYFAVLTVVSIIVGYIFPILSRFQCKGKQLFVNAFVMCISYPKESILLCLAILVFYGVIIYSYAVMPFLLFFAPVLFAIAQKSILEKIFIKYIEEEKEE